MKKASHEGLVGMLICIGRYVNEYGMLIFLWEESLKYLKVERLSVKRAMRPRGEVKIHTLSFFVITFNCHQILGLFPKIDRDVLSLKNKAPGRLLHCLGTD